MIKVRAAGIDSVIRHLEEKRKALQDEKLRRFLEKLAQIGIETADVKFRNAEYDGTNDVVVSPAPEWVNENTLTISASGTTVLFIEFGTGVHYAEQHPKADEFGFVRGGYGKGQGKKEHWGYYGEPGTHGVPKRDGAVIITQGNPPARAMYDAGKEIRQRIADTAREVFST